MYHGMLIFGFRYGSVAEKKIEFKVDNNEAITFDYFGIDEATDNLKRIIDSGTGTMRDPFMEFTIFPDGRAYFYEETAPGKFSRLMSQLKNGNVVKVRCYKKYGDRGVYTFTLNGSRKTITEIDNSQKR